MSWASDMYMSRIDICMMGLVRYRMNLMSDRMDLIGGRGRDVGSILYACRMGLVGGRRRDGKMDLVGGRRRDGKIDLVGGRGRDGGSILDVAEWAWWVAGEGTDEWAWLVTGTGAAFKVVGCVPKLNSRYPSLLS
jgi:hypothetical protein